MIKFNDMTSKAARIVSRRNGKGAERFARNAAFDIASSTDYTEDEAYAEIMRKAALLAQANA